MSREVRMVGIRTAQLLRSAAFLLTILTCLHADDKPHGSGDTAPPHLKAARELLKNLDPENNSYKHSKPVVSWKDSDGKYELHTDCSGFIDALFMHCYGYDRDALKKWLGKSR